MICDTLACREKFFFIFGVKVGDNWQPLDEYYRLQDNANNIFNALQFPNYVVEIDFNQPELSQNTLVDITVSVDSEFPVGILFFKSCVGDGVVACAGDEVTARGDDRQRTTGSVGNCRCVFNFHTHVCCWIRSKHAIKLVREYFKVDMCNVCLNDLSDWYESIYKIHVKNQQVLAQENQIEEILSERQIPHEFAILLS